MYPEQVLLINMPFGPLNLPSLGLSLLKGALNQKGILTKVCYYNILFANTIGEEKYKAISNGFPRSVDQAGEWLFSACLFPDKADDSKAFINEVIYGCNKHHAKDLYYAKQDLVKFAKTLLQIKQKTDAFLDTCLEDILKRKPKIVGFTSIFQQHVASLALAKKIKAAQPDILIIFGGANCEGAMGRETLKQFHFVDAIVSGEGDEAFPMLVETYLNTEQLIQAPGIHTQQHTHNKENTPVIHNMDAVAIPDFFDFFNQYKSFNFKRKPKLLLETSRGCWWGEKKHCTFCGLNGGSMAFRSKTENRVLNEFRLMKEHFPDASIAIVDNILDMKYFKKLLPDLVKEDLDLDLFFEVKANLKKSQVQLLKDAGIHTIQPGIESFSDKILNIMKKGVKAIQNIQLLKWCKEIGVNPQWNLIWGFQGETEEDYAETVKLIPYITHLKPPVGFSTLRLDRFSPNYNQSEALGFNNVQPYPSYEFIYPFLRESIANLAYYFSFEMEKPFDEKKVQGEVIEVIRSWRDGYPETDLFFVDKETVLLIWDFRPAFQQTYHIFDEKHRAVYLTCEIVKTPKHICSVLLEKYNINLTVLEIENILTTFIGKGLMLQSENYFLSLAIPTYSYVPSAEVLERLGDWVEQDKKMKV